MENVSFYREGKVFLSKLSKNFVGFVCLFSGWVVVFFFFLVLQYFVYTGPTKAIVIYLQVKFCFGRIVFLFFFWKHFR